MPGETDVGGPHRDFQATYWTTVLRAQAGAGDAFGRLVERYWKPVYYLIRRRGHDVERAKDLTQEFFARVLERNYLRTVSPERGRFRSWVRAAVVHFLANERDRESAKKRPPLVFVPDFVEAERRYDPSAAEAVERAFDRWWAEDALRRARQRLAREYRSTGREVPLEVFEAALAVPPPSHRELATRLSITEKNVANHLSRARARLREILLEEVRETLDDPADADDELRHLMDLLR